MNAVVVAIGNELTLGQTVDTNSAWLSRAVAAAGVRVREHVTVDDDLDPIRDAILRAAQQADVVLVTGGLGPTADDLTRQAIAAAMGVALELHEPSLEAIRRFFAERGREMPHANRIQAMVPAGAAVIENTCGTAPGIHATLGGADIFAMPGVPREMRVMFEQHVRPFLLAKAAGPVILATTINTFGAGESDVGTLLADLMRRDRNPTVGTTARQAIIGVRIHAFGETLADAQRLLEADVAEIERRLGPLIFGRDEQTLADAVAARLTACGLTVATAESCTGGLIAKRLTDIAGSSAYFLGGIVAYANKTKTKLLHVADARIAEHGAVSAAVAEAMAVGARNATGADLAISATGIAGPSGGTAEKPVGLVHFGLASADGCELHARRFGPQLPRAEIRDRAAKFALNLLRLALLRTHVA
jgi:nicotinamide-nucleotide amidase